MNKKPNIIFIFSDQQRRDTIGCYGQVLNVTPNLDKLAEEGVIFENAFTPQPVCGPARACIQTGKYATQTGCFKNDIALNKEEKTIAHYMSDAGYRTGYIGKWHLASTGIFQNYKKKAVPKDLRGGWNEYWLASDVLEFTSTGHEGHLYNEVNEKVSFNKYRVDALTDYAIDFIDANKEQTQPFFLFISYLEPHHQNTTHQYEGPEYSKELFSEFEIPGDLKDKKGDTQKSYPDYLGCCHSIDKNLERITARLKKLGLYDDTTIIYTSDHGSHFRTRNSEYKRSCHESSISIPMIIKGSGFNNKKSVTDMVSLIDLPPTILKIGGVDIPEHMVGRPLQELQSANKSYWKKEIFIQISESQVGRTIRTERWKYSVSAPSRQGYIHSNSRVYIEEFLYDLEKDPYEKNNLVKSGEFEEIRNELAQKLKQKIIQYENMQVSILPRKAKNLIVAYLSFIINIFRKRSEV